MQTAAIIHFEGERETHVITFASKWGDLAQVDLDRFEEAVQGAREGINTFSLRTLAASFAETAACVVEGYHDVDWESYERLVRDAGASFEVTL